MNGHGGRLRCQGELCQGIHLYTLIQCMTKHQDVVEIVVQYNCVQCLKKHQDVVEIMYSIVVYSA
jgi:hypothetical protein